MERIKLSDISLVIFIIFISQVPQAYIVVEIGATIKDELVVLTSILLTILGMVIISLIIIDYLRQRILEKHSIQTPLLAVTITIMIQYLLFVWILSELSSHILFRERMVELFVFSQMLSILIPLASIAFMSSE